MRQIAVMLQVGSVSADHRHGQAKVIAVSRKLHVRGPRSSSLTTGCPDRVGAGSHRGNTGDELATDINHNQAEYCSDGLRAS
jgi:hypothetical protein